MTVTDGPPALTGLIRRVGETYRRQMKVLHPGGLPQGPHLRGACPGPPGAPWALAAPGTSAVCASLAVEAGGMLRKRVWSWVTQLVAALCWISQDVAGTAELL